MAKRKSAIQRGYMVKVHQEGEGYRLGYVPNGLQQEFPRGGAPQPVPEYVVRVNRQGDEPEWLNPPDERQTGKLADDAKERVRNLRLWAEQLEVLISQIEGWAKALGWSTKRVERPLEDTGIGSYKAHALLMQNPGDASRVLLEPVSRTAPGTEGVVDLYHMPAYDDIASLYYYGGRWNVHYMFERDLALGNIRDAEALPLSQETLGRVLTEMKNNA